MSAGPRLEVEYGDVRELHGPLLVVQGVQGVGWDEFAVIRVASEGATEAEIEAWVNRFIDREAVATADPLTRKGADHGREP